MTRRRHLLVGLGAGALVLAAACGAPTAQRVAPEDSPFSFEVPVGYTDIPIDDAPQVLVLGPDGLGLAQPINDPLVEMWTVGQGDSVSYKTLRELSVGGEFDPLDEELDPLPNNTQLVAYSEIGESEVWGIRIRLLVGATGQDFLALVDRHTDHVVLSRIQCTQACFVDQLELIDEIQNSWSLDDPSGVQ